MKYKYKVNGLDCANCTQKLEDSLNKKEEINDCVISFATGMMTFESEYDIDDHELLSFMQSIEDEVTIENLLSNITHQEHHEEHKHDHEHEHHDECGCHHEHDHDCCGHEHHHHDHDGECGCGHDHDHEGHHHADDVFSSWGTETPNKYDKETLEDILKKLANTEEYGKILRSKGMLPCTDGTWMYFDLVPGEYEIRDGKADFTGRICVIGAELKEDALKTLFEIA